jgi:hypothetical protein
MYSLETTPLEVSKALAEKHRTLRKTAENVAGRDG